MSNFKLVAPYCGVSNYDKTFFVYYMNTEENLRREYIFNTDKDASDFSNAIENLTVFMKSIPARKKEAYPRIPGSAAQRSRPQIEHPHIST